MFSNLTSTDSASSYPGLVLGSHRRWPIRHEERLHALGTFSQRIPRLCEKWASGDEVRGERPQMLSLTYR